MFLDRDGTVIEHVHHLSRVDDVQLITGAAAAIKALRAAGYLCVIVTNQSVVGRGLLDVPGLELIHQRMLDLLSKMGAELDGIYYCTVAPQVSDQAVVEHVDRKPGPGMLRKAAADLGIEMAQSWMMGDSLSDLLAGQNAGCKESLLVLTGYGQKTRAQQGEKFRSFPSIEEAAAAILNENKEY
ncbi:MAG TPA: HAD-IIIA family hydrolase [Polyangiaceae bacterium]|nr:HAD-IIIA family hydrolase [Polyangiaceae bacterium]